MPQSLRIASINCYLIPKLFVGKTSRTCEFQERRSKNIGHFLRAQHDVVGLQEVWGSNSHNIQTCANCVLANRQKISVEQRIGFLYQSWGSTVLDVFQGFVRRFGGLQVAYDNQKLDLVQSNRHTFTTSISMSKKGVVSCLFKVKQDACSGENVEAIENDTINTPKASASLDIVGDTSCKQEGNLYVLLFNTHLDPVNFNDSQRKQLAEVREFIEQTVTTSVTNLGIACKDLVVLCTGDFNIDGNRHPDLSTLSTLEWTTPVDTISSNPNLACLNEKSLDLYRQFNAEQPDLALDMRKALFDCRDLCCELALNENVSGKCMESTYEYGRNSLCMYDSRRLDYILAIDRVDNLEFRKVVCKKFQVMKQARGEELSDHWPVVAELVF